MKLIDIPIILLLVFSINFRLISAKSVLDSAFEKYTYKSQFTDKELFQSTFTKSHLEKLKIETKSLFKYSWDKYMNYGYPFDEVCPLTCQPNKRDIDEFNTVKNDALGNFSITLFDSMDTFIIMGDKQAFAEIVSEIKNTYKDFAIDSTVQIFETNIRLLGSLLTAHLYAIDPRRGFTLPDYDGFLLKLAYDLGKRLILSFFHKDEDYRFNDEFLKNFVFNYPRTNLLRGPQSISSFLKNEQCTAGVTSLTLEFSLLSRLTNDTVFEDVSTRAVLDFWSKRSKLDLIPMSFETVQRSFPHTQTGVGASIDSFYEYALKYSILFDNDIFYDIWKDSYQALLTHSQNKIGIFTNVDVNNGMSSSEWIDSLAAFFPGLQVLAGDLQNSVKFHSIYFKLWNKYVSIPERWNFSPIRSEGFFKYLNRPYKEGDLIEALDIDSTNEALVKNSVSLEWYPLRPELIESTYHLYTATKDPFYLRLGEDFLEKFRERFIAPCGFSGSLDVINDSRQNRQESFVLSETLKYLYLLFDVENPVQKGNMVFSTEGHPFWFDKKIWNYDPIRKHDLEVMNQWNETEIESKGFFDRLLFPKKFILNKEFAEFNNSFYENHFNTEKYLIRIDSLESSRSSLLNNSQTFKYGDIFRVGKTEYENFKREKIWRRKHFNNMLKNSGKLELDDDYLNLDKCDVIYGEGNNEIHDNNIFPLESKIMNEMNDLYRLDWEYAITLRQPLYLLDREDLEIDDGFYNRFTGNLGNNSAICNLEQTTIEWEALIASGDNYNVAPIHKFKGKKAKCKRNYPYVIPQDDDIFLEELEGVRIQLEEIEVGKVDSRGDIITFEYIEGKTGLPLDSMIRLTKINGFHLERNTIVWVFSGSVLLEKSESIHKDGEYIFIGDKIVENMRVLQNK